MKYDFETLVPRRGIGAEKWEMMKRAKPDAAADAVPLSVADMELRCAPEITDAIISWARDNAPGYSSAPDGFYECVCRFMEERHGLRAAPEEIVTTPGVVYALLHAVRAVTEPDDGVVVMPPVYYPFYRVVDAAGRRCVRCPLINDGGRYSMDFEKLAALARDAKTTALILCSPHNPVGRVWTRAELSRLAEICLENGVFVISDEIHFDLVMPGFRHTPLASLSADIAARTITCTAPSKTFNLAGLNHSNIIVPDAKTRERFENELRSAATPMQTPYAFAACRAGYERGLGWLSQLIGHIDGNRKYVEDFCAERIPEIIPSRLEGTYLQWLDLRAFGKTADELERTMIAHDLFFDEGRVFGAEGEGFERMNLACPRFVVEGAMARFEAACAELRR
jgi:putative C-S lyase